MSNDYGEDYGGGGRSTGSNDTDSTQRLKIKKIQFNQSGPGLGTRSVYNRLCVSYQAAPPAAELAGTGAERT